LTVPNVRRYGCFSWLQVSNIIINYFYEIPLGSNEVHILLFDVIYDLVRQAKEQIVTPSSIPAHRIILIHYDLVVSSADETMKFQVFSVIILVCFCPDDISISKINSRPYPSNQMMHADKIGPYVPLKTYLPSFIIFGLKTGIRT
jgi:hypothetical protein